MKIYFLKRPGGNWWGNLNLTHEISQNGKEIGWAGIYFVRKKDAEVVLRNYDSEYGNPFEIWSAEVRKDKRDNRRKRQEK